MSLIQFYRIFWAQRWLIGGAALSCLIGAMILTFVLPPRWESHARVVLDTIKPDPITGLVIGNQESRIFAATQIELITDTSVAGQVAEQLGWLTDPALLEDYRQRPASDQRDFRSWLSQLITDNTDAKLVEDTNVVDITYTGTSPEGAKAVADVLRRVYIQDSVLRRREDAQRNAQFYEQEAGKARVALDQAIKDEGAFERQNGVVMANDKIDAESARMQALTATGGVAAVPFIAPQNNMADMELSQVDSQIAASAKVLGPNNPEMQALRTRRASVAALAAQEREAARTMTNSVNASRGAYDRALADQKSKLITESPKIAELTQLQNDVNLRRDELAKLSERVAYYRQEALISDVGLVPLGPASTPKSATFPNYLLIVPGSIILGGVLGVLVVLLLELLARRVRGVEDLASLDDIPVVGVIAAPRVARKGGRFGWIPRIAPRRRIRNAVPA